MIIIGLSIAGNVSTSSAMLIFVFSGFIVFVVGYGLLKKNIPSEINNAKPVTEAKTWIVSTSNLAGINGLDIINRQVSLIIVGLLLNNPSEIGYYKIAINFSFLSTVGLQIANVVFEPRFAALFAAKNKDDLQKLTTLSTRAVLLFNLLITGLLIVFGKPVLSVAYGKEFLAAYLPMVILLSGQFINSATGTVTNILNMAGKEKLSVRAVALGTAVNLVLNTILTPNFGILGAAIGTSISLVFVNILLWLIVKRELGINSLAFTKKNE
jgi:O-antigen/teichoic acid export membrane protein